MFQQLCDNFHISFAFSEMQINVMNGIIKHETK
jgi:hypothetical protein